ncbi:related to dimeric dihydrodiol dehydrogenase [Phialocephala subalpina]|uniref:D-xylose 1-dehydrogenase (NADP(+), D-xylono-1,5-lactone-forming) n=1 Tax=Phialocephala subalpina TaxID=576137 RepID=A0A1L7XSG6_9HELO|nr:related to dimeric dihydrodiol dehydrogenase [Phialocephala subalpina]
MGSSVRTAIPELRWGILGTGWISTMFVKDLLAPRSSAPAKHTITALGSSSLEKGNAFVEKVWGESSAPDPEQAWLPPPRPVVYADYQGVYRDGSVDMVYIGTPHSLHKANCLDAIAAGKHVLCEKPLTINGREAQEVVDAARKKGVFIMEGALFQCSSISSDPVSARTVHVCTALSPKQIEHSTPPTPPESRSAPPLTKPYPLAYLLPHPEPSRVISSLSIADGIDESNAVVLEYPTTSTCSRTKTAILSSTFRYRSAEDFARIEGSSGTITIFGLAGSVPADGIDESNAVVLEYPTTSTCSRTKTAILSSTFRYRSAEDFARIEGSSGTITIFGLAGSVPGGFRMVVGPQPGFGEADTREVHTYTVERLEGTLGFFWEADAVALDIANGRTENGTMPVEESLRIMKLMDGIRRQGGLVYPQDG